MLAVPGTATADLVGTAAGGVCFWFGATLGAGGCWNRGTDPEFDGGVGFLGIMWSLLVLMILQIAGMSARGARHRDCRSGRDGCWWRLFFGRGRRWVLAVAGIEGQTPSSVLGLDF